MFARMLFVSSAILLASTGFAQEAAPAAPAASGMDNCMARHDHAAEKGTPTPRNCMHAEGAMQPASAASAPAKKKIKGHDHAKFHKNQ